MEDKKKYGLIAAVTTLLVCACPGACVFFYGALLAAGEVTEWNSTVPPQTIGLIMLCVACFTFLIPVAIAAFTFWPKKAAGDGLPEENEAEVELPPAI